MTTYATRQRPDHCPSCPAALGQDHDRNCAVLAEVITNITRDPDRYRARPEDLARTGCDCSTVLIRYRGRHGHRNVCKRTDWITPTTRPTTVTFPPDAGDPATLPPGSWTAVYLSGDASRDGRHPLDRAAAYTAATGFHTWDAAADHLDAGFLHGIIPVGVFLASTENRKAPTRTALLDFLHSVAALSLDGEQVDGQEHVLENDDAVEDLTGIITAARTLLGLPAHS